MKKGNLYIGRIEKVVFPNKGLAVECRKVEEDGTIAEVLEEGCCIVKNTIPGQMVTFRVNKSRKGKAEGRLMEIVEKSELETAEDVCPHFGICGGCNYQSVPYEKQLEIKCEEVFGLLDSVVPNFSDVFEGIKGSPVQAEYRNKMEFTFGDGYKDGPMCLGMHKRGSFYDIVTVDGCRIIDGDYRQIIRATLDFFENKKIPFYHRMRHEGYLRHLLVRKAVKTQEILVDLVTSTQMDPVSESNLLKEYADTLLALDVKGSFAGILHTKNDSVADVVKDEGTEVIFGKDHFYEELLGLKFKISPFSFFQTNSLGAELLYETARTYIREAFDAEGISLEGKTVFDLYSGTGTIAQMLAAAAGKVIGVEIIEEAVEAAKDNAKLNGLTNCDFIAGDVLKVIDDIEDKPDFIVLDPPRDGIHPKALTKIINYGVENIIYISCKPTSLQRDLEILQAHGYRVKRACCVDMFPATVHCESIAYLSKE